MYNDVNYDDPLRQHQGRTDTLLHSEEMAKATHAHAHTRE